ncbi:RNA polymerase sigma factor [Aquimarina agarivorans]|uniref:RNA polymerase sigma factor n=1 Tax=Aquimarina agarivorans TaxID=980584 RepID=UPI000248E97A|nr:RNA polymerase sigma factor [Aquimarina agarivorans]
MKPFLKVIRLYKNEATLIKGVLKNNRDAQHRLFEIHAPKMLSVCRYYIKDLQQSEEVMLTGFLKVFKKMDTFEGAGSLEGWIRKIMVREAISYLRSKKTFEFAAEELVLEKESENNIQSNIEVAQIQSLIDALPDGYKLVFVMYAIEGYKHAEIAQTLNINEGTSKSQLYKARKLLQKMVSKLNVNTHLGYL